MGLQELCGDQTQRRTGKMNVYEVELFDDTIRVEADKYEEEIYSHVNLNNELFEAPQYVFYKGGEPVLYVPKKFVIKPIKEVKDESSLRS